MLFNRFSHYLYTKMNEQVQTVEIKTKLWYFKSIFLLLMGIIILLIIGSFEMIFNLIVNINIFVMFFGIYLWGIWWSIYTPINYFGYFVMTTFMQNVHYKLQQPNDTFIRLSLFGYMISKPFYYFMDILNCYQSRMLMCYLLLLLLPIITMGWVMNLYYRRWFNSSVVFIQNIYDTFSNFCYQIGNSLVGQIMQTILVKMRINFWVQLPKKTVYTFVKQTKSMTLQTQMNSLRYGLIFFLSFYFLVYAELSYMLLTTFSTQLPFLAPWGDQVYVELHLYLQSFFQINFNWLFAFFGWGLPVFPSTNLNYILTGTYDSLGMLFMGLTFLLLSLCIFFLFPLFELEKNIHIYLLQLLILFPQLQITFTTNNLLTFFVAFESLLIPMILLITLFGSPNRRQANNYLVFYTMVSAIPMLLAIIYIQQKTHTLNLQELIMLTETWTWSEQVWLWLAFFVAFAVKTPMVPVHIWLPKAHVDAPTVGSVILAGLLLKIGLVGFIRFLLPIFPQATHFFSPYIAVLATVGVIYSSLITLRQVDMKRIIAYSSVAHMNMALVSLCSLNPLGLYSSIYLMLSHGLIAGGLFFLVGFLYNRFHVRSVFYFGGLATMMPMMTLIFFFFSLANMAFPFTSGFIGEFLILLGITSTNYWLGFINASSMLLTTAYTLLLFGRVFLGQVKPTFQNLMMNKQKNQISFWSQGFSTYDLYYYEFLIMSILLILIVLLGCYPQLLLNLLIQDLFLSNICQIIGNN